MEPPRTAHCVHCGEALQPNQNICGNCGRRMDPHVTERGFLVGCLVIAVVLLGISGTCAYGALTTRDDYGFGTMGAIVSAILTVVIVALSYGLFKLSGRTSKATLYGILSVIASVPIITLPLLFEAGPVRPQALTCSASGVVLPAMSLRALWRRPR